MDHVQTGVAIDVDDRVRCLLEVSRQLVATFDLEAILQAATDAVTRLAGLDTAAVYLMDADRLRLWATTPPLPPGFPEHLRNAPIDDHPHLHAAIDRRAPITLPDMLEAELTPAERMVAAERHLRTVIYIPLVGGGKSTGTLIVGSVDVPRDVSPADIDLCFTLANVVAMAVENARLFHASVTHVAELKETLEARERAERERLELERQLLHAQRLESLGLMAGGIAHDFNNLLLAMLANLELARRKLATESAASADIERSIQAARRAADLTAQMLAYAGKGNVEITSEDLNDLVGGNSELFRSSIGRSIQFDVALGAGLPPVMADRGQIQQVILNLITNASEALGDRAGTIEIKTGVSKRDEHALGRSLTRDISSAERFVYLEVSDTGCGMDEQTRARLFDPFYSTKGTGRGLGMAAILGIVQAHHGAIFVDTAVGEGTTVRVLLPALRDQEAGALVTDERPAADVPPVLSGTVLLADDEEMIRSVCQSILELEGLRVLTASDGVEAVELFRRQPDEICCVILDQTMPNMDGLTAYQEITKIKPDARVLLMSGYAEHDIAPAIRAGLAGFIQKPYTVDHLLQTLASALAGSGNAK